MYCGYMLSNGPAAPATAEADTNSAPQPAPTPVPEIEKGPNWAAIGAALLAFIGLRHASRRARQATIVFALFMLFFGCPLACGLVSMIIEGFSQLFH